MKDQCNICFCNLLNKNYCILKKLVYQDEFAKQTRSDNHKLILRKSCKDFLRIKNLMDTNT
jgi:hypothetical protein